MPIYNSEIAEKFKLTADLLEIKGANQFRVRAYKDAARTIERESKSIEKMVNEGKDLTEYEGVGEDLAGQIKEIVRTGKSNQLKKLEKELPVTLTKILDIEGVGPKSVQKLYKELNIQTISDLEDALKKGEVRELEGFGEKTAHKIQESIDEHNANAEKKERTLYKKAEEIVKPLKDYLKSHDSTIKVQVAGSYRRKKETVGDIDILATSKNNKEVMDHFLNFTDVEKVVSKGETKSTVILRTGMQVDLRVVKDKNYGAALLYFTGSKSHNIGLRDLALDEDWKVNEYGVFNEKGERFAGETEEEVYEVLDLEFIEPEMRENRGEIEAAIKDELPRLLKLNDIKGDLQMHSTNSDGKDSIERMGREALKLGREYIAITDHSSYVGITQGLKESEVDNYIDEIHAVDKKLDDIKIFSGIEVDILEDGSLDFSDEVLEKFDLVVCSVHSKFDLPIKEQTERIIIALSNPLTKIFAHPTGRKIQQRKGYKFDMEKVFEVSKKEGCYLEINAHPQRLDLDDMHIKAAKESGVKMVISTDAHSIRELNYIRYGVNQARRGWAEKEDIINTESLEKFKNLIDKNGKET